MALVGDLHRHDARPAPRFGNTLAQLLQALHKDLFDPYRPERHYMRGPGPKWHAKHAYLHTGQRKIGP